ncbi:hypothetical protein SAMN05421774_10851 [Gemmobacter megaterium]|uniref:Uncharacterized protein n=1 Tax=Gemmobacter megaterium TaxID=1086013 RepID=A0A1N7QAL7_9RHOB|nr:hypothetical protein [Gemmobacter megaterium]GGE24387.1 hypothetical protein GCM10011345_32940 [Gemmobacter megaterium]SIT19912.1 hypothetical protein SAMN05421774_10851 [Gemmobacter megaterium]
MGKTVERKPSSPIQCALREEARAWIFAGAVIAIYLGVKLCLPF